VTLSTGYINRDNIISIAKESCLRLSPPFLPLVISFAEDHARLQRCHKHSWRGKGLTFAIKNFKKFYGKKHVRQIASKERQLPSKRAMNLETLRDDKSTLLIGKRCGSKTLLGPRTVIFNSGLLRMGKIWIRYIMKYLKKRVFSCERERKGRGNCPL